MESFAFFDWKALVALVASLVSLVAWAIRLEAKANYTNLEIMRLERKLDSSIQSNSEAVERVHTRIDELRLFIDGKFERVYSMLSPRGKD